jgi:hypothetical protein
VAVPTWTTIPVSGLRRIHFASPAALRNADVDVEEKSDANRIGRATFPYG